MKAATTLTLTVGLGTLLPALASCRGVEPHGSVELRASATNSRLESDPGKGAPSASAVSLGAERATPAAVTNLESVLTTIAAGNPTIAEARERVAMARAAKHQADALLWPELSVNLGYVATDEPAQAFAILLDQRELTLGPSFDPTPGTTENWRKELRLDWALFAPGRSPARSAAREDQHAAELAVRAVERRLLNAGVQAWVGWKAARALEAVTVESVAVVEERVEQTRRRFEAGAALRADVLRLETRLAAARQEAERASLGVRLGASALNFLMGRSADAPLTEATESTTDDPAAFESLGIGMSVARLELSALQQLAETERLDLAAASHRVRAVGFQRRAGEDRRLPSVGLFAAYDVDGPDPGIDTDRDSSTIGVGLRLPLSRRTSAAIEFANAAERRELIALRVLADQVAHEVHDSWASLEVARGTLALAESAGAAAEEAYRIVAAAQDAGASTVTDVLEAEDARRRARVGVVSARAGVATAEAKLVGATGGIR